MYVRGLFAALCIIFTYFNVSFAGPGNESELVEQAIARRDWKWLESSIAQSHDSVLRHQALESSKQKIISNPQDLGADYLFKLMQIPNDDMGSDADVHLLQVRLARKIFDLSFLSLGQKYQLLRAALLSQDSSVVHAAGESTLGERKFKLLVLALRKDRDLALHPIADWLEDLWQALSAKEAQLCGKRLEPKSS